jgi:hypothetical protein
VAQLQNMSYGDLGVTMDVINYIINNIYIRGKDVYSK